MAKPDVNALPTYLEQNVDQLIAKSVLGANTLDYISTQTGIKTSASINLLNTDVEFGDGSTCGFEDRGNQSITQRVIETGQIKVNMSYCEKNLLGKYTEKLVKIGATEADMPLGEYFTEDVIKAIKSAMEKAIWQGDKSSGDANLNKFDGFLKIMANDENVNKLGALENDTPYNKIKTLYERIPVKILDEAVIFVGAEDYRSFIGELVEKNLYHYSPEKGENELYFPGSTVRVIKVNGLNQTGKMVACRPDHLFYGTDLESNTEVFDFFYSRDNREFRLVVEWNAGVNYAFSDEITLVG